MRTCPTHQKELRVGKTGNYYCSTKVGDGWCQYREYDNEKPPVSQPVVANNGITPGVKMILDKLDMMQESIDLLLQAKKNQTMPFVGVTKTPGYEYATISNPNPENTSGTKDDLPF